MARVIAKRREPLRNRVSVWFMEYILRKILQNC